MTRHGSPGSGPAIAIPDLKHDLDNFIALDGEAEIGLVKWVETGPDHGALATSCFRAGPIAQGQ